MLESILDTTIYLYRDTCNVYIVQNCGKVALIDFGRGDVLKDLSAAGLNAIEGILHTHHHREQCQGDLSAVEAGIPVYVPGDEAELFNSVERYWNEGYSKRWDCLGAPYVRPLIESIRTAGELAGGGQFNLGDLKLCILDTPGHSPGSVSFLTEVAGRKAAFVGDLLMDELKIVNLYDCEWDYGYLGGLQEIISSCRRLQEYKPDILLPSHGKVVFNQDNYLEKYAQKLEELVNKYLVRDYDDSDNRANPFRTQPTCVGEIDRVSEHVLRWHDDYGNMYILFDENAHRALLIDAGIINYSKCAAAREALVESRLDAVMKECRIDHIDAVVLTHYHGDHMDILPYLKRRYGIQLWCYENMAGIVNCPEQYAYPAVFTYYGVYEPVSVDRVLHENEWLEWGSYRLRIFHLPGQTLYATGIETHIDGLHIVFTGDNLFYSRTRSGHDAFVTRNKVLLEEGYGKCARILKEISPDLLLCGHSFIIHEPGPQIDRLLEWSRALGKELQELSPYDAYEWIADPFWVEALPHRSAVGRGGRADKRVMVKNHHAAACVFHITIVVPQGLQVSPHHFVMEVGPKDTAEFLFHIDAPPGTPPGRYSVAFDIREGGTDHGQLFDTIIEVL